MLDIDRCQTIYKTSHAGLKRGMDAVLMYKESDGNFNHLLLRGCYFRTIGIDVSVGSDRELRL